MAGPQQPESQSRRAPAAPLVPLAAALTFGIIADRTVGIPLWLAAAVFVLGLGIWLAGLRHAVIALSAAFAALGAAHHRQYRDTFGANDIGAVAREEPRLMQVRGILTDEPERQRAERYEPLRSVPRLDYSRSELEVVQVLDGDGWRPASGRVRLIVAGELAELHAGDTIEATGWLSAVPRPANPGEFDAFELARDQRIRGVLNVRKSADAVACIEPAHWSNTAGWIASVRRWARKTLETNLPPSESPVAAALLLGDGSAMTRDEWSIYIRTGVVHALAISGQHLVVLAAFLWFALRAVGVRRRHGAWMVALALIGYAILTGGRPPAIRSAVQVAVVCGAIVFRRVVQPANSFALAWIIVLIIQPTDIADTGFALSFLCVAILNWWIGPLLDRGEIDPLDRLIAASRPWWMRIAIQFGKWLGMAYLVSLILGIAVMPLTAWRYHLLSFAGIVIGAPVILLTSVALVAGFLLLLVAPLSATLPAPFAWVTSTALAAVNGIVAWADRIPGSYVYVGDVPLWWVVGIYVGLFALIFVPRLRTNWRVLVAVAAVWFLALYVPGWLRQPDDALRATFLAVGHGGCTVIETPDGRIVLYDAGAMNGPEVTQRIIAPYLWWRGISRIDDLMLSHADLDHFNGVPALLARFRVGRVIMTPSFAEKPTPGVREALRAIDESGARWQVVVAGDRLTAGDVEFEVLHPPPSGPAGIENVRSLVVQVRHAGHTLLLTGDLQESGLEMLLRQPRRAIDVMQAPHHGSRSSNTPALASWAQPRVVVASAGPPVWPTRVPEMYADRGAAYLSTWPHGATTIVSRRTGLTVETFRTRERIIVRDGKPR